MNPLDPDFVLSTALAADHSGSTLRQILDLLEQQRAKLRQKADLGLAPEAFAVSQALQQSCATAAKLVDLLWYKQRNIQENSNG